MLTINSIRNGIVIDHIKAGQGVKIFNYLGLDNVNYRVALIMNVESNKLGRKDIIKIENVIDLDFTVLGLIAPNATINIIDGERIEEKLSLNLPTRVENIIKCKNPRCITSIEQHVNNVFYLVDKQKGEYRCEYCDEAHSS